MECDNGAWTVKTANCNDTDDVCGKVYWSNQFACVECDDNSDCVNSNSCINNVCKWGKCDNTTVNASMTGPCSTYGQVACFDTDTIQHCVEFEPDTFCWVKTIDCSGTDSSCYQGLCDDCNPTDSNPAADCEDPPNQKCSSSGQCLYKTCADYGNNVGSCSSGQAAQCYDDNTAKKCVTFNPQTACWVLQPDCTGADSSCYEGGCDDCDPTDANSASECEDPPNQKCVAGGNIATCEWKTCSDYGLQTCSTVSDKQCVNGNTVVQTCVQKNSAARCWEASETCSGVNHVCTDAPPFAVQCSQCNSDGDCNNPDKECNLSTHTCGWRPCSEYLNTNGQGTCSSIGVDLKCNGNDIYDCKAVNAGTNCYVFQEKCKTCQGTGSSTECIECTVADQLTDCGSPDKKCLGIQCVAKECADYPEAHGVCSSAKDGGTGTYCENGDFAAGYPLTCTAFGTAKCYKRSTVAPCNFCHDPWGPAPPGCVECINDANCTGSPNGTACDNTGNTPTYGCYQTCDDLKNASTPTPNFGSCASLTAVDELDGTKCSGGDDQNGFALVCTPLGNGPSKCWVENAKVDCEGNDSVCYDPIQGDPECVECLKDQDCADSAIGPSCNAFTDKCQPTCPFLAAKDATIKGPCTLEGATRCSAGSGKPGAIQTCTKTKTDPSIFCEVESAAPAMNCSAYCLEGPSGAACVECLTDKDCQGNANGSACGPSHMCVTACADIASAGALEPCAIGDAKDGDQDGLTCSNGNGKPGTILECKQFTSGPWCWHATTTLCGPGGDGKACFDANGPNPPVCAECTVGPDPSCASSYCDIVGGVPKCIPKPQCPAAATTTVRCAESDVGAERCADASGGKGDIWVCLAASAGEVPCWTTKTTCSGDAPYCLAPSTGGALACGCKSDVVCGNPGETCHDTTFPPKCAPIGTCDAVEGSKGLCSFPIDPPALSISGFVNSVLSMQHVECPDGDGKAGTPYVCKWFDGISCLVPMATCGTKECVPTGTPVASDPAPSGYVCPSCCVECLKDAECMAAHDPTWYCDIASSTCKQLGTCQSFAAQGAGAACVPNPGVVSVCADGVQTCTNFGANTNGIYNAISPQAINCMTTTACKANQVCLDGIDKAGNKVASCVDCVSSDDCDGLTVCNTTSHTCVAVECKAQTDCLGGTTCYANNCVAGSVSKPNIVVDGSDSFPADPVVGDTFSLSITVSNTGLVDIPYGTVFGVRVSIDDVVCAQIPVNGLSIGTPKVLVLDTVPKDCWPTKPGAHTVQVFADPDGVLKAQELLLTDNQLVDTLDWQEKVVDFKAVSIQAQPPLPNIIDGVFYAMNVANDSKHAYLAVPIELDFDGLPCAMGTVSLAAGASKYVVSDASKLSLDFTQGTLKQLHDTVTSGDSVTLDTSHCQPTPGDTNTHQITVRINPDTSSDVVPESGSLTNNTQSMMLKWALGAAQPPLAPGAACQQCTAAIEALGVSACTADVQTSMEWCGPYKAVCAALLTQGCSLGLNTSANPNQICNWASRSVKIAPICPIKYSPELACNLESLNQSTSGVSCDQCRMATKCLIDAQAATGGPNICTTLAVAKTWATNVTDWKALSLANANCDPSDNDMSVCKKLGYCACGPDCGNSCEPGCEACCAAVPGQICDQTAQPKVCIAVAPAGTCTPKSCTDFPGKCGLLFNGCNDELKCGCGASAACISGACVAIPANKKTCAAYVGSCGTALSDGVGGTLDCSANCNKSEKCVAGTCVNPMFEQSCKSCDDSPGECGVAGVCVAVPGFETEGGVCGLKAECDTDGDCASGWICSPDTDQCTPVTHTECEGNTVQTIDSCDNILKTVECPVDTACVQGACVPGGVCQKLATCADYPGLCGDKLPNKCGALLDCTRNCPADQICNKGVCRAKNGQAANCGNCATNAECQSGRCVLNDPSNPTGQGYCGPAQACDPNNDLCPTNWECDESSKLCMPTETQSCGANPSMQNSESGAVWTSVVNGCGVMESANLCASGKCKFVKGENTGECAACVPKKCSAMPGTTGSSVSDGCGKFINCSTNGVINPKTGVAACKGPGCKTCTPKTCANFPGKCGTTLPNGCGGYLNCSGSCAPGTSCKASKCQTCKPKTCAQLKGACGAVDNGCGAKIQCGCATGQACMSGKCVPESNACNGMPTAGCCSGTTLHQCVGGKWIQKSCGTGGNTCGWTGKSYGCTATASADPSGTAPLACAGTICQPKCGAASCGQPDTCGGICPCTKVPGDVAPAQKPNGCLNMDDVLTALQLAVGNATATALQSLNGDVVPAAALDGLIDVADVVAILETVLGFGLLPGPLCP